MISAFIRDPDFVGQTKDRLSTTEAQRLVEGAVRDHWDNWLAADPRRAANILDFFIERAEERQQLTGAKARQADRFALDRRFDRPAKPELDRRAHPVSLTDGA